DPQPLLAICPTPVWSPRGGNLCLPLASFWYGVPGGASRASRPPPSARGFSPLGQGRRDEQGPLPGVGDRARTGAPRFPHVLARHPIHRHLRRVAALAVMGGPPGGRGDAFLGPPSAGLP